MDATIRNWQAIWRPSRLHMTQSVQIGLVGELLILTRVLVPVFGTRAVACWSGADKERHDFIAGTLHLEVKTTTRSRHEHEISRLDQLWIADGRSLILASIRLEQSIGGTIT
ncbi:PD-(D/E)XK motif protein, partial [Lysobacter sp. TAB13]|uniref:PD-(D/E)XK motif protein n=1 Tax=Lysobacter sp. TAB13 TaxID=3233065 RepID=UPI003F9BC4E6